MSNNQRGTLALSLAMALYVLNDTFVKRLAAPLIITLFVLVARIETVRLWRVAASFIGFAGVIMVLRPAYDAFGIGALLALVAALGLAGRDIVIRRMPGEIPSALIALVTTAAVALVGCLMAPFETWQPLVMRETLYLAAAAIFAAVGNYALIIACRDVDLSAITPFRYTILLWAFIAGYVVWGDTPDLMATLGMLVIVTAGFHTVRSDRKLVKAVRGPVVR